MDIAKVRKVLTDRQHGRVDGFLVDSFTASAIVQVYDALSPRNRAIFAAMPIDRAARVAFKLINKR